MRSRGTSVPRFVDEMPEVVLFRRPDRAVGQEHVRAALREPAHGVVGVDPRVHAFGARQFRQRRAQFGGNHGVRAEQRVEKRWNGGRREHQPFSLALRFRNPDPSHPFCVGYSYGMPRLTFLGAAQTVTGSKYLLETNGTRLLVDCGLFQGLKSLRERNWADLPVDPASIHAVVLTHAHLDHSGYLPRLVAQGFRGRIFCTPGTADLCRLVLPDAARLQEEDAREANRHGYSKHAPALPLFTESDAFRALTQLQPVGFHRPVPAARRHRGLVLADGSPAWCGGSDDGARRAASASFSEETSAATIGPCCGIRSRSPRPTCCCVESTYGDRRHEPDDRRRALRHDRARDDRPQRQGRDPGVRDRPRRGDPLLAEAPRRGARDPGGARCSSTVPMAVEALGYYGRRVAELDDDMREEGKPLASFATRRFQTVSSAQQSAELVASRTPSVIVSASGMATGGRVLHHLKRVLPDARNTVLFVGYQAPGTRGRSLVDGAQEVKIHGQFVPVSARIERIDAMSAHADCPEILRWLRGFAAPPAMTYIVHGEPPAMQALQAAIARELGPAWKTHAPAVSGGGRDLSSDRVWSRDFSPG